MSSGGKIAEMVLFVSTPSQASMECGGIIQQQGLPVKIVRLDSAEIRKRVWESGTLAVRNVPALLITTEDGGIEMFEGRDKVMGMIARIFSPANGGAPPLAATAEPSVLPEAPMLEGEEPSGTNLYGGETGEAPVHQRRVRFEGEEEEGDSKQRMSQATEEWLSPSRVTKPGNHDIQAIARKMKADANKVFQT